MLTDDDLTRELTAAFHDETDGLAYGGKVPRLRRKVPLTSLPIAAAAAAIVIVPQVTGDDSATHHPLTPSATASVQPRASRPPAKTAPVKLYKVQLAGFTFESTREITEDDPLVFSIDVKVPADAKTVGGTGEFVQVWVGTDQKTGYPAVWLKTGSGTGPNLYEVYAFHGDWTTDELTQLVERPVEG